MALATHEMNTAVIGGSDGGKANNGATLAPWMVAGETAESGGFTGWKPEKTAQEQANEKREAVESLFGQTEVFKWTENVYADVLTREFVALQDLKDEGVVIDNPQVWHNRLNAAMDVYFSKSHTNGKFDVTKATKEEQYQAYRKVFVDLLQSDNKEEGKEWLLMAMKMGDRQKPAIMASTQAHIDVVLEADQIEDVADYIAISPALADSGIPLDQLRTKIEEIRKSMFRKIPIPLLGRFLKWLPATAAQSIIDTDKAGIQELWNRYKTEHSKSPYSSVKVDFANGDTYNLERTIDGHALDAIQRRVLKNLPETGQLTPGAALGARAQKEIRTLVEDITKAEANASWVVLNNQRRTSFHFNPVAPIFGSPNEYVSVTSALPTRVVRMGGIDIPIAPDIRFISPDDTLNAISMALDKRLQVKQGEKYRERARDVVDARIAELKTITSKSEHTPAQQLKLDQLEETIKQLGEHKTLMSDIEKTTKEVQQKQVDVELQKKTLTDPLAWQEEVKTREETIETKNKEVIRHKAEIEHKKEELVRIAAELDSLGRTKGALFARTLPTPDAYKGTDARTKQLQAKSNKITREIATTRQSIKDLETGATSIEELTKEIADRNKKLEPYKARLETYKALKKEVDESERALALNKLRAEKSMGMVPVIQLEERMKELAAEKAGIIGSKDAIAEHERIALEAFQENVLDPDKLQIIRHRAREQKVDLYDVTNNESIIAYTELKAAVENRVDVPPAYLQTMRIFMGPGALKADTPGKGLYNQFTHMLTPKRFLEHYMNDDPDTGGDVERVALVMNAFFNAHGEQMPDTISVYDPRMQHDEIRSAMLQGVDRDFIQMLIDRMSQEANQGTLGVLDVSDQQRVRTLQEEYIGNKSAIHQERLQRGVKESVGPYAYSMDARVGRGIEEVRVALSQNGANLEQAPRIISYTHKLLQSVGTLQLVDIHDGVNYTVVGQAIEAEFVRLGINVVNPADIPAIINTIDSYSIASSDVESYIQVQDAVQKAGIAIDKTDYTHTAVKRAMVHAGVSYGYTLQVTDVMSPAGALTPVGEAVTNELAKLGIALAPDNLVQLANTLHTSSIPQARVDGMSEVVKNIDPAIHVYTDYISLAALRTIQEMGIDRRVALVVLTPDIKANLEAELQKIDINIAPWSDDQLLSIIEAARPENHIEHTDIDTNQQVVNLNKWLQTNSIFDATSSSYDIIHSVSGAMRELGITGSVNVAALTEQIMVHGGRQSRADALKALINIKMGFDMDPVPTDGQLIALVDNILPISTEPRAIRGEAHMLDMHGTLDIFFKHDGDYHNGTALALLLGGLDADTARQVSIAVETVVREKKDLTIASILGSLTQPPQGYVYSKALRMINGPDGLLNKYNVASGAAIGDVNDIPLDWLRRNMADFASGFYQNRTNPIHTALAADQSSRFFIYANRLIDQVDFPRMQTWFSKKYWGEQDPFLLASAISTDLGFMMSGQPDAVIRQQALQLANAIVVNRGVKVAPIQ